MITGYRYIAYLKSDIEDLKDRLMYRMSDAERVEIEDELEQAEIRLERLQGQMEDYEDSKRKGEL